MKKIIAVAVLVAVTGVAGGWIPTPGQVSGGYFTNDGNPSCKYCNK